MNVPNSTNDTNFLVDIRFKNTLPNAPSGPYFKKMGNYLSFSDSSYRTSTLENEYIWQPHLGQDCGLTLDLVDQDSVLAETGKVLDPQETKYIKGGDRQRKGLEESEKPWWLRRTTYMDNDLFKTTQKGHDTSQEAGVKIAKTKNEVKLRDMGASADPFAKENVDATFAEVEATVEAIQPSKKRRKMLWSRPVLPMGFQNHGASASGETEKYYTLARFDEDPSLDPPPTSSSSSSSQQASQESAAGENEGAGRKRSISRSVITNVRKSGDAVKTGNIYVVDASLIAPYFEDTVRDQESQLIAGESSNSSRSKTEYRWVKDYRMEITAGGLEETFLFCLDSDAASETAGAVAYIPLKAKVELKKKHYDESIPHDSSITRIQGQKA